jgi:hypothetical protein
MRFVFLLWALVFLVFGAAAVFGSDSASLEDVTPAAVDAGWLSSVVVDLAVKHPWIVTVLLCIALLRVVFKPIVTAAHWYVNRTPSEEDNLMLGRVERSVWFTWLSWFIDFFASIKINPQTEGQNRLAGFIQKGETVSRWGR